MPMKDRKTIVITGVTRGLGRAMVDRFVESGHVVLGCGRSAKEIEDLRGLHTHDHSFEMVDVSVGRQVERWATHQLNIWGPPDFLINNAGTISRNSPLWDVSEEEFARLLKVNIAGVANVIRAFVPAMIERRSGIIVNISSGWGRSSAPGVAAYCATKWAIEGLTQALSKELPKGVIAVALNPGIIFTDMLRTCWPEHASEYPSPEEWSRTAVPFILGLLVSDNGKQLKVPIPPEPPGTPGVSRGHPQVQPSSHPSEIPGGGQALAGIPVEHEPELPEPPSAE